MISEKRHEMILSELRNKEFLTLQELVDHTGSSASTVRRDLSKLQQMGKLSRVHGGAALNQSVVTEAKLADKRTRNLQEKQEIARQAAEYVEDHDCIFLDAGSTTLEMIPFIRAKHVTVVTNGLTHVEELLKYGFKTLTLGGEVKATTLATVGVNALETLKKYRFDKAFIGINGLDLHHGLTTPDEQEALIKAYAIDFSFHTYVLADHTKYDKVYFATVPTTSSVSVLVSEQITALDVFQSYAQQYHLIGGLT
ncbi:DeoR/GlpR family DNA-binding transcription regulator [Staphylococcus pettenkoferi]|uniref:DeoR/GlpR family DNA-binding transcription regulator n=2 Tax=Staphylococcus TaxID=1279 RepID=A0ABT4BLH1_9STAP|nr:DeoR/GlpR family DNA-binding transcription regulator [Staphylococcus pettenkoferi]MCY1564218.1 DeoR/GlpR family DNA-binding transcription regulator [Staphylococcus pettenkoferi]MCY1572225.1 DeoR/GlpR family DNA-binding transcription regulator [Staphylococcus pettenkoferi]MCY1583521.1 DeoR/GlpR family DNA-binding transcription regulator [Staphylococcus pettenkoferi]MCY1589209.1 DeoR/GlpR family DNA-binding transcription regulator [Staphylococcus pettenkoferi]MCY1591827.1 DeoR/GlpR family DNA